MSLQDILDFVLYFFHIFLLCVFAAYFINNVFENNVF